MMDSVDSEDSRGEKEPPGFVEETPRYDSDESLLTDQYDEPTGTQLTYGSDESLLADDHGPTDTQSLYDSDEPLLAEHQTKDMANEHVESNETVKEEIEQEMDLTVSADTSNAHAKQKDDVTNQDEDHVIVSCLDNPVYTESNNDNFEVTASESLENPAYTDSLSSNDSKKALLGADYDGNLHCINFHDSEWDLDPDKEVIRDRSNTIGRLAESNAYIESIGYTPDHARLSRACRNAVLALSQEVFQKYASTQVLSKEQLPQKQTTEEDTEDLTYITRHKKNLIFLSISITLMYTAIGSLRNLQSSMNHEDGIGLYSLAASYCGYMLFSLFTPFVVQKFKPKKCLLYALIPQLLYVVSNLFPSFYIFIPASFLQGVGNALLWNSMSTYTTYLARARALQKDEKTVHIASRYFGIFFFFYQFAIVTGNLISSLVLLYGDGVPDYAKDLPLSTVIHSTTAMYEQNSTYAFIHDGENISAQIFALDANSHFSFCGARYCHSYKIDHAGMVVSENTKYTLLGVYGMCVIFAIVVVAYLLDPVKTYRSTSTDIELIGKYVVSIFKCIITKRFLLLIGLFLYSCMQMGFALAEITKAFVTCPVGIYMVGYTMICFGVFGGIGSYVSGRLDKHIGRISLITTACVIDLGLLLFMFLWQPQPGQDYVYFILLGAWGIGDGILISQTNSMVSAVFPDMLEEAFAAFRITQGFGFCVSFMYGESLCMLDKMYILAGVAVFGTASFIVLEILLKRHPNKDLNEKEIEV